jgi:hypothetical protein
LAHLRDRLAGNVVNELGLFEAGILLAEPERWNLDHMCGGCGGSEPDTEKHTGVRGEPQQDRAVCAPTPPISSVSARQYKNLKKGCEFQKDLLNSNLNPLGTDSVSLPITVCRGRTSSSSTATGPLSSVPVLSGHLS